MQDLSTRNFFFHFKLLSFNSTYISLDKNRTPVHKRNSNEADKQLGGEIFITGSYNQ